MIPIVLAVVVLSALIVYCQVNKSKNDSVWQVKKEELIWPETQEIIGSGTFGVVLLAEFRGTQVAVKRVLPHRSPKSKDGKASTVDMADTASSIGKYSWDGTSAKDVASDIGSTGMKSGGSGGQKSGEYGTKSAALTNKTQQRALREGFMKEMRLLSKLRHPCITTVMGAVIGEDPLLILEYMDHGSLYDLLHNASVPLEGEILLPMLADVTQGCRFLHSALPPVIHGDLKSANILVDARFRAKVADFGLSVSFFVSCWCASPKEYHASSVLSLNPFAFLLFAAKAADGRSRNALLDESRVTEARNYQQHCQ